MAMPQLGPPTPTQQSPFAPIPYTQPYQPPAPTTPPAVESFRRPGTTFALDRLRAGMSDKPYEQPAWAQELLVSSPDWQAGAKASAQAYQAPGFPERISVNAFGEDPIGQFLGGDAGVALGMTPGQQQGGTYHGIATAPVTLANFSTWGREGLLAAVLDLAGKSEWYTPAAGATFGQQPSGPPPGEGDMLDALVGGLRSVGDALWAPFEGTLNWYRNSNAFNRGKAVRDIFAKGEGATGTEYLTNRIAALVFGGSERFTMDALRERAARDGVDYIDLIAELWDMSVESVASIARNPWMSDEELGQLTDGQPLSYNALTNLALEGSLQMAMLAVGGVGVAKGAAALTRIGELPAAFGAGLRGLGLGEGASAAATAARTAGYIGRKALQINAWNTTAGWTVRGAEWGIKQIAAIAGNDELVKAMDRMMWTMPLSMNPGWNLIDGFSSHPIDAARNLRQGQVSIGRRGTPGYVGQLDLRGLALRDGATGQVMTVAGRVMSLRNVDEEFRTIGLLRDLTPEDMHAQFFSQLGWGYREMDKAFGEGNPYTATINGQTITLSWDDARNALFHVALEAVRESKGQIGRPEGLNLTDPAERTAAFVRNNAKGSLKVMSDNFTGKSDSMVRLFKGDFWDLAARNDSRMAAIKAPLGEWDRDLALADFVSWVRASKIIRNAIEQGVASRDATASYTRRINRTFIGAWLQGLEQYAPDEVVPLTYVNRLKKYGGAVEVRGKGDQLVRARKLSYTRRQLESIVDDVLAVDELMQKGDNAIPRAEAAAYRKGIDPGQDPIEDARVAFGNVKGFGPQTLDLINKMREKDVRTTNPPTRLMQLVAKDLGRTADSILREGPEAAWQTVFKWLDDKMAMGQEAGATRDLLDRLAETFRQRVAGQRMDAAEAAPMISALTRIRDELLTPLDPKLTTNRPGLLASWRATAEEAVALAQEIRTYLDGEATSWRTVEIVPGTRAIVPPKLNGLVLKGYQEAIARALDPTNPLRGLISDFDRQRLADPDVHPFLKDDILRTVANPADKEALDAVRLALDGDPREVLVGMVGDAGLDPSDMSAALATMASQADGNPAAGAELGARAAQLARRFQTLGGSYSDELGDIIDRLTDLDRVWRASRPKGSKNQGIEHVPMDPEASAKKATVAVRDDFARARSDVRVAEDTLAQAERNLAGIVDRPTAFDPETMVWDRRTLHRTGSAKKKRELAEAEIAQLRREGQLVGLQFDKATSGWEVLVAKPKAAPRPARTTPVDLAPLDGVDAVKATIERFERGQADNLDLLGLMDDTNLADPAYQPEAMDSLRAYLVKKQDELAADIEKNPRPDGSFGSDPREDVRSLLVQKLQRFTQRDIAAQRARETAAVAEGSTPEGLAAAVQGRIDTLGGTPDSGGATIDSGGATVLAPDALNRVVEAVDRAFKGDDRRYAHSYLSWSDARRAGDEPAPRASVSADRATAIRDSVDGLIAGERPRAQGGRIVFEAPPEAPQPHGFFPDPATNEPIGYQLMVVDANQLTTSADEGFDPSLQPRMRFARQASDEQIASIAQGPDPARLLGTETGAQGTPVILTDGQVLAGNGRVTGIRQAYADGRAGAYTAALGDQAAGTPNPVLVRVINVDHDTAMRLAVQLNFETGMPLADQAVGLSRLLTADDIGKLRISASQSIEDALDSGVNDAFVTAFLAHVPEQFRGPLKELDGSLNQQGRALMAATLLARFTDASRSPAGQLLIATLFEGDPEVRSLAAGLDAVGALIQAQIESVDKPWGGVTPAFAADLVPAIQRVFSLRRKYPNLRDVQAALETSGLGLVSDDLVEITQPQQVLARNLALMAQPGGGGAEGLRDLLRSVARRVRGSDQNGVEAVPESLFALPDPTYPDVVNESFRVLNRTRPEGKQFAIIPDADGIAHVRVNGEETATIHTAVDDPGAVVEGLTPAPGDIVLEGNDWRAHADTVSRSTGRIVISAETDAEAARLTAYLNGDDSAQLHRRYRVVNGEYEPLGDIRGELADRIRGRFRSARTGNQEAGLRYLNWKLTQEGVEPPTPPNVKSFVDAELDYRKGPREVPLDPAMPALRDSLAGRDWEVRVGAGDAPGTEFVAGTPRRIDPDFEKVTGLPPEHPTADARAREALASGRQRVTRGEDEVQQRAAQRASGAPVNPDEQQIIMFNRASADELRAAAADQRDRALANAEAARQRLAALGAEPDAPAVKDVLSGSEQALYQRYLAQTGITPPKQPRTIGETIDALTSLDLGMPPATGTMTEAEMEALRGALLRTLDARMNDLGAGPSTGPARRAGPGGRRHYKGPGQGTRVTTEPRLTAPEDLSADLAEVVRTLQSRVYEAEDALDGWEGTQYDIGMLPKTSTEGGPLAPRIPGGVDWIDRLDELVPSLGDELIRGRKRTWAAREEEARWEGAVRRIPAGGVVRAIREAADTAFGARPEKQIVKEAMNRWHEEALKHFTGDVLQREEADGLLAAIIDRWHKGMKENDVAGFQKYRRTGLVPPDKLESWAVEVMGGEKNLPDWYVLLRQEEAARGVKHPLAEAWRRSDNRIRARFAEMPGGMAAFLDSIYDSRLGRTGHAMGRNLTVGYHIARFLMDLRFLGLEAIEAPTLVLFREGPGAFMEGLQGLRSGKPVKAPLFLGRDVQESMRTNYAWWLAQSDPGLGLRVRERYILAMARRYQEAEFPRAMMEVYNSSPDVRQAVDAWGGKDPMSWLRELDADWELAASRGKQLEPGQAERLFKPWLDKGVISGQEYAEFVATNRYTGHPAIDAELARVADPRLTPLLERVQAINEQGWNDATRLIFGPVDRSNVQRLMNHPLLYWPISYQIKATKWLAGLLFDRAFGIDTGAGGAVTLGMIHQQHKDRMANDPDYALKVSGNATLLFIAQMLFPISPTDLGVGLSPFTRLALSAMTQPTGEGYSRNVFGVGGGYTYFSLLPRFFYEQSKEGSWAQETGGPIGDIVQAGQRFFPYSVPVKPKSSSQLYQAEQQVYGNQPIPPTPPSQPPATRY